MVHEASHVEAGVRQVDSERCMILCPFCFGKIYEILDSGQEFPFGDVSGSIVLAQDLEWTVAIVRQIVTAITFPIPGRYRQRCREIVRETDAIYGVVSSSAAIGRGDFLADTAILIDERLLGCFGSILGFGFFCIDLGHEIAGHHIQIIAEFLMVSKLLLEIFELDIEISFDRHVAGAYGIELRLERVDRRDVVTRRFIGKRDATQKSNDDEGNAEFLHDMKKKDKSNPAEAGFPKRSTFNVDLSHLISMTNDYTYGFFLPGLWNFISLSSS